MSVEPDHLFDGTGTDAEIATLEAALGGYAHREPLRELPRRPARRTGWLVAGGGAMVAAAAVLALWLGHDRQVASIPAVVPTVVPTVVPDSSAVVTDCTATAGPGFAFSMTSGAARCGETPATSGTLPVGTWLETARDSVARVTVADIGQLTVYGDSKLRIVDTSAREHRMELQRGHVSARVVAPPRLFVIDTPAGTAVDLGCAYDLTVDADGRTHLRVTSGAVSLEGARGAAAYVVVGHQVDVLPGRVLGTPVWVNAPPSFAALVARFDAGDHTVVGAIAAAADPQAVMTLWNLVARTTGTERETIVKALETLVPLRTSSARAAVLCGDPAALEAWREPVLRLWLAIPAR